MNAREAVAGSVELRATRRRPQWRMGDVFRGLIIAMVTGFLGSLFGLFLVGSAGLEELANGEASSAAVTVFACLVVGQGLGLFGWPVFLSMSKGNGLDTDFGWRFRALDVPLGAAIGVALLGIVFVVTSLVGIGLDVQLWAGDGAETSEEPTTAAMWIVVVFAVVLVAPITEEIFFRGLVLRTIQRSLGIVPAILVSTLIFTLLHLATPNLALATVVLAGIAAVGLVLAVLVARTGRLGPAIIAHGVYNTGVVIISVVTG